MVFLIAPNGHGTSWAVDHSKDFFKVSEKTITFKFGFTINLDLIGRIKPFNRIVETIKTLQSTFPEFSFVFCGWELIECVDELYNKFPDAEFFVTTTTFIEDKFQDFLKDNKSPISQLDADHAAIRESTICQFQKINNFLNGKEYNVLLTDPKFSLINFRKFQGIYIHNASK
jgi:hypothetical protein